MPRQDINGNDFEHHINFPNDQIVRNIEFAAGRTFFGKREFPNCYLTDVQIPSVDHFMKYPENYEEHECHYLDQQYDYNDVDLLGRSFDNVLICNPRGIGFRGMYQTKAFLEKARSILSEKGIVIVIGNSTNPWSNYRNLTKYYDKLITSGELVDEFTFDVQLIDVDHPYRENHKFYITDFSALTFPNEIIKIQRAA